MNRKTKELRSMLDDRGVEWKAGDYPTCAYTYWGDWFFMEPLDAKPRTIGAQCELTCIPATPEQAIAATLDEASEGCYLVRDGKKFPVEIGCGFCRNHANNNHSRRVPLLVGGSK